MQQSTTTQEGTTAMPNSELPKSIILFGKRFTDEPSIRLFWSMLADDEKAKQIELAKEVLPEDAWRIQGDILGSLAGE